MVGRKKKRTTFNFNPKNTSVTSGNNMTKNSRCGKSVKVVVEKLPSEKLPSPCTNIDTNATRIIMLDRDDMRSVKDVIEGMPCMVGAHFL